MFKMKKTEMVVMSAISKGGVLEKFIINSRLVYFN